MKSKRRELPVYTIRDIEEWGSDGIYSGGDPLWGDHDSSRGPASICLTKQEIREVWRHAGSPRRFNALDVLCFALNADPIMLSAKWDTYKLVEEPDFVRLSAHMIPSEVFGYQSARTFYSDFESNELLGIDTSLLSYQEIILRICEKLATAGYRPVVREHRALVSELTVVTA